MSEFITKSRLKSERGWSDKAMATLLGECDVQAPNPHGHRAPPMRLYLIKRVEQAESSQEFRQLKEAKERRGEAAREAAERRRDRLLEEIAGISIEVPRVEDYRKRACRHYDDLWMERGQWHKSASLSDGKEFLDRICVNYLRHEMSEYEERLLSVRGRVGSVEARQFIKQLVLEAIAWAYPELHEECRRQIEALYECQMMR